MRKSVYFLLAVFLSLCSLPALASMGDSDSDLLIQMYTPPNKFNLFQRHDFKNLDYSSARTLKICDTQSKHAVGLDVTHDGTTSLLKAGSCQEFTAKNFRISPNGVVNYNYDLTGTIEKLRS